MNKERAMALMGTIDPALVEEAGLPMPAGRRFSKTARTVLLAACLCLALLGTAFAANPEAVATLIERLTVSAGSSVEGPGYSVTGGAMTKYPLSAFSSALIAASEGREAPAAPVSLAFDTWDEVRAFLGEDIPCVWPEGWEADWFQVVLFHTEYEVLWGVDIYSVDLSRQAEVHAEIRTELWPSEAATAERGALDGSDITQLPSYSMPNGAIAELVQVANPVFSPDGTPDGCLQQCHGYFLRGGILYAVTAYSPVPPQESTEAQLKTVLDSFP